ncbi:putative bifunctional diguanylate cyclase/phosphodiesterase [Acetobacterium sp.]|uniref:putative bifunctional diguanylate cyclase/phosphodiesterase n=1 Tax=Acetobacterium sp. TaxID=1872094 RepID=UPI0035945419
MKFYFEKIVNLIAEADDREKIKVNETILMLSMLGPMLLMAAVISGIIGTYWQERLIMVVIATSSLFFCGLFMMILIRLEQDTRLKTHFMSIALLLGLLVTFVAYYERITIIFWMIILIMIIMSNTMIQRTLFYYMIVGGVVFFPVSLLYYPIASIQIDDAFNLTLVAVLLCIIVASVVTNRIYQQILVKKSAIYADTVSQKEDINQLYEDVFAHHQQLKAQNDLLLFYNTEFEANQERLEFLAYTDTLTGMPNRKMILEQIDLMIDLNKENPHHFALVFIDLDNFKKINDSMGHGAGDLLLQQLTTRLRNAMDDKDLLGRLGGDELAILIRRQISNEKIFVDTQKLQNLLGNPFRLDDKSVIITASFGIAIWPVDASTSSDLLKAADTAMYKAKATGKNCIQFYRKEMRSEVLYKMELENQMIEAFEKEMFFVEYQPIVDVADQKKASFEALLRWEAPGRGLVSPAEFIPMAEEIGFIGELGEWVLRQACAKIKEVRERYDIDIHIAVNISAVQMKRPDFLAGVKAVFRETGTPPERLTFEITESVFIGNMEQAIDTIRDLKKFGVMISLDDFGTGYSSLSYLLQLPIDVLKIDRSFIALLQKEDKNNRIVGSIIEMVHGLGIQVVAEGVEEILQLDFLKDKHCDWIQGYLMSRPLGDAALAEYLLQHEDEK